MTKAYDDRKKELEKAKRQARHKNKRSRLQDFTSEGPTTGGDWGGCTSEKLQAVVAGITAIGGAVTFGLARDKRAHSLTLMLDGDRKSLWFAGDADLDAELDSVVGIIEGWE